MESFMNIYKLFGDKFTKIIKYGKYALLGSLIIYYILYLKKRSRAIKKPKEKELSLDDIRRFSKKIKEWIFLYGAQNFDRFKIKRHIKFDDIDKVDFRLFLYRYIGDFEKEENINIVREEDVDKQCTESESKRRQEEIRKKCHESKNIKKNIIKKIIIY